MLNLTRLDIKFFSAHSLGFYVSHSRIQTTTRKREEKTVFVRLFPYYLGIFAKSYLD